MALWYYNSIDAGGYEGEKIFFHEGVLVRLETVDGDIRFVELDKGDLRLALSQSKWSHIGKDGTPEPVHELPYLVIESCLKAGRGSLPHIPEIKGFYTGILLTSNGDVISRPGYNQLTGLYLTEDYPPLDIPEHPTSEDVQAVRDLLWSIFHEFTFADDQTEESTDYQNVLVALLMAIFRPTWEYGAMPIWIVDKTTQGAGASLLQSIVCRLATGHVPISTTAPQNNAEFDKLYQTFANEGRDFALIDNITRESEWVTPGLLTATSGTGIISFRGFRTQNSVTRKCTTFYAFNGIHLDIREDVCRRIVVTRLNPPKAWQELEGYFTVSRHDLELMALKLHPEIIKAAAVLLRYWKEAGEPNPPKCSGNISEYPEMYRIICGMLHYAGYKNVLANMGDIQNTEDESIAEGIEFLEDFGRQFPNGCTPKDLQNIILQEAGTRKSGGVPGTNFMDHAPEKIRDAAVRGTLAPERVGHWLTSICGTKYKGHGCFLERAAKKGRGGRKYYLKEIAEQQKIA